jgi:hypothetical protein
MVLEVISLRILKLKEGLEFVSMEQMKDVWGLSPEVIVNNTHFKVFAYPNIERLISASVKEIAQFPYFRYALAKDCYL